MNLGQKVGGYVRSSPECVVRAVAAAYHLAVMISRAYSSLYWHDQRDHDRHDHHPRTG
jgi:hypothetical protein